jgi:hypothetical protein
VPHRPPSHRREAEHFDVCAEKLDEIARGFGRRSSEQYFLSAHRTRMIDEDRDDRVGARGVTQRLSDALRGIEGGDVNLRAPSIERMSKDAPRFIETRLFVVGKLSENAVEFVAMDNPVEVARKDAVRQLFLRSFFIPRLLASLFSRHYFFAAPSIRESSECHTARIVAIKLCIYTAHTLENSICVKLSRIVGTYQEQ